MKLTEEQIETALAEHRPSQEVLDVDRISGPFVEGDEFIVGAHDQVYRASVELTYGEVYKLRSMPEDQVEYAVWAKFKPAGLAESLQHPLNAWFILGAWSNVSAAIFNAKSGIVSISAGPTEDQIAMGQAEYDRIKEKAGFLGALMPGWDQLDPKSQERYIKAGMARKERGL